MSDYIKREDAMAEFVTNGSVTVYGIDTCKAIISRLQLVPSADVVEVVRCKDCEHGQSYNMFGSRYCLKHNDVAVRDNDFCSQGERVNHEHHTENHHSISNP